MPAFKPLDQQVIVITGASSGIGLATAQAALAHGAKVVLAARSGGVLREVTEGSQGSMSGEAVAVVADVARREEVQRIADTAIDRFGRIDTWINNAGVSIYGPIEAVSEADNRRLFDTNFWGVVNGSLVALPHLKVSGGALINVGSEVSEAVIPLQGMYTASKHAVKGFTDALRVELEAAQAPVAVTLVQPTAVNTPFPERARNYLAREPKLPEPQIEPEQVATAILDAATSEQRDIKVGFMAKMNTTLSHLLPSVGDRRAAKQTTTQQRPEAPQHPEGTLHGPGAPVGNVHGRPG